MIIPTVQKQKLSIIYPSTTALGITVSSHERHYVWNHHQLNWLCNNLFKLTSKKSPKPTILAFVRGIHRCSVDSPHKGPVTRRAFSMSWRHHGNPWHSYNAFIQSMPSWRRFHVITTFSLPIDLAVTKCWTNNPVPSNLKHRNPRLILLS